MNAAGETLGAFFGREPRTALVEVADAAGSTPREKGAWMLVGSRSIFGTIGGGQLEFRAIEAARRALDDTPTAEAQTLDIPLGPEIGQCCGGRVQVAISRVDRQTRDMLLRRAQEEESSRPHVYLFGGGHVGRALAAALALLPVRTTVVETRPDAAEGFPPGIEARLTPVPEEVVRAAPPGSAFVVLTHEHALDFLIVAEALKRADAAYVGMIGSKTKRATFRSWYLKSAGGLEADVGRLTSPIGGASVPDKRPAVIAALAAAEIMTALFSARIRGPTGSRG